MIALLGQHRHSRALGVAVAGLLALASLPTEAAEPASLTSLLPRLHQHFQHPTGDWQPEVAPATSKKPNRVVAADGSGTHRTIQDAFDSLPQVGTSTARMIVQIKAGVYHERPCLDQRVPVLIFGVEGDPSAVRITGDAFHQKAKAQDAPAHRCHPHRGRAVHGTAGSATLVLASDDVQLQHLTVENVAGAAAGQAVALYTRGDRIALSGVRVMGYQDTLLLRRHDRDRDASDAKPSRVWIDASLIAGTVDFVFGDATAAISRSTLYSRDSERRPQGYVLAPSTPPGQRGFLVTASRFAADPAVTAGSVALGRAWDEGVAPGQWRAGVSPDGEAIVTGNQWGTHIASWAASTARREVRAGETRLRESGNGADDHEARRALAPGDGWASIEGGTRGGSDALPSDLHVVRTRRELMAAMAEPHRRPRLVKVQGRIRLDVDDRGRQLNAADFADSAFDAEAFARTFDPAVWGRSAPAGPLEEARKRSSANQRRHVVLLVPSQTTLFGATDDAAIEGGMVLLERVHDVIVRNLSIVDAFDHFPAWDPTDGSDGAWNSIYDTLSLVGATHVWIDRCSFSDGRKRPPAATIFGNKVEHYDGLLDITRGSDLITVSLSRFSYHNKTSLVGGSDRHTTDAGRLRVSFRHNFWEGVEERAPRVRYGLVHVAHNLYDVKIDHPYGYSIGVGLESTVLAEGNVWDVPPGFDPARVVRWWGGQRFADRRSTVGGVGVDLTATSRAEKRHLPPLLPVSWQLPYQWPAQSPAEVRETVSRQAGAGRLK